MLDDMPSTTAFRVSNLNGGEARMELSKQWAARPHDQRFLSLDDMAKAKLKIWQESREAICKPGDLEAVAPDIMTRDDMNKLAFRLDGDEVPVNASHWAFGQLCQRARAPASYMRTLPSPIVADAVNYGLQFLGNDDGVKIYVRHNGEHELRAVTGPDYGRIPDHEVIAAVQGIAGTGTGDARWKVPGTMDWSTMIYDPETPVSADTTTLFASDRDMFIFLVDDRNPIEVGKVWNHRTGATEPDLMFRGFYITNSEVGAGALKLAAFYLRSICCNRIMWGVEGFEEMTIRHTKLAPHRFVHQAEPALNSYANGSVTKLIDGVNKAKAAKVADDDDKAVAFLKNRGFSMSRAKTVLDKVKEEEGRPARTAWDMAQGITALARSVPNNDDRVNLELEARKILDKAA